MPQPTHSRHLDALFRIQDTVNRAHKHAHTANPSDLHMVKRREKEKE